MGVRADIEIFERRLAGEGGGGLPRNNIQVPKEVAAKTRDGHRPAISRTKSPKPTTWQRPQSENEAAQVISDLDEFERKNGLLENE